MFVRAFETLAILVFLQQWNTHSAGSRLFTCVGHMSFDKPLTYESIAAVAKTNTPFLPLRMGGCCRVVKGSVGGSRKAARG